MLIPGGGGPTSESLLQFYRGKAQFEERHEARTVPETKQLEDRLPGIQASKLSLATNTTAAEHVKEKIGSEEFLEAQQRV